METIKIVVEGVSEEQIQRDIERNTRGWRLFLEPPKGQSYTFLNPFFGHGWDGSATNLCTILKYTVNNETKKIRPHLCIFSYNGEDRFVWCSWERVLYDINTKVKHPIEPKFSVNITELINSLFNI